MNIDFIKTELEKIGTINLFEESEGKLNISLTEVNSSTYNLVEFLRIYSNEIYEFYKAQELFLQEGNSIKAIYSNDPDLISDDLKEQLGIEDETTNN